MALWKHGGVRLVESPPHRTRYSVRGAERGGTDEEAGLAKSPPGVCLTRASRAGAYRPADSRPSLRDTPTYAM